MILHQKFFTYDGACKRARFEAQHSPKKRYTFGVVRFRDGRQDDLPLEAGSHKYHWQLRKTPRAKTP